MAIPHPLRLAASLGCLWFIAASPGFAEEDVATKDPYAARKVFYEAQWQEKVEQILHYIDGVVVSVNVELSPEIEKRIVTEEYQNPVPSSERSKRVVVKNQPATAVAQVSQGPGRSTTGASTTEQEEEIETESAIPRTETEIVHVGLIPKRVSVSIAVPRSFAKTIAARQRDEGATAESAGAKRDALGAHEEVLLHTIENAVNVLLPRGELGDDEYSRVEVHFFDDKLGEVSPWPVGQLPASPTETSKTSFEWTIERGTAINDIERGRQLLPQQLLLESGAIGDGAAGWLYFD